MVKPDLSKLSITQLADLTGRTFRTVKDRLKDLEPAWQDGRAVMYDPQKALPLIYDLEKPKEGEGQKLDLTKERARLASAQADKTEIQVLALRKEMLPAEEVERVWTGMVMNFRAKILVLPSRLATRLAGMKKAIEIQELLKKTMYEALDELSDYNPDQFNIEVDEESAGKGGPAGGSEGEPVGGSGEVSQP